tara:strand:- start:124 stop:465 length:342 start_codon:yes stop_codon:yes gene_type:complete
MLDVLFILLIFFIVTATFVKEMGLDLPASQSKTRQPASNESLVLRITSQNQYKIGQTFVDLRRLKPQLSARFAEAPERPLVIAAHGEAQTELLVHAMDVARQIGMEVGLASGR